MNMQIIERNGKPEWAIVPYKVYLQLVEQAEMLHDIYDFDTVKEALNQGNEELIPSQVVYAILDGSNPIRVWREYRGISQQELAERAGISVPYLSQIEKAKRKGSLEVLNTIARVLKVSLDDLVPQ
jgi:DNA-binding XRE family transcriptional regulator